jgi:tetratricopeptide (TPR) repeat protein
MSRVPLRREPSAFPGAPARFRGWLGLGIVLAATAFLYAPALDHQFTNWDDDRQITANPDIRDWSPQGVRRIFTSFYVSLYQPLTSLSWAAEYRFFGLNPRIYHAVNILLHLANIVLVYVLVRSLAQNAGIAVATAALFAVHPLQVEATAWVSSRSILLSSLFYVGATIAYLAYARSGKMRYFLLGLVLFVPALLAKTTAATLPLVLIVIDLYLRRRIGLWTACEKMPFFVLSGIFAYITMAARSGMNHLGDFHSKYSAVQHICIVCYCCLWYVGKLILPAGLSIFCPFPKPNDWLPLAFYLAPLLLIGIAVGISFAGRYRRLLVFAALFMLASLVLVVQIIPVSELMVCDRYAYLPCLGVFFLVGTLGHRIGTRSPATMRGVLITAAIALVALGWATHRRIGVWHDSMTLWNNLIDKRQDLWIAYQNRGRAEYEEKGDSKAAIADFNTALRLNPRDHTSLNNRAAAYVSLGDRAAALRDFDEAIRLNPDNSHLINRGILKRNMGDLAGALQDFNTVIERTPRRADALCQRADTYRMQGNWAKAIADYEDSLRLDPKSDKALNGRAISYACLGDRSAALRDFDSAIRLNPDSSYFLNRGIVKRDVKDFAGALQDFDVVIERDPRHVDALYQRAETFRMQGNWTKAKADYEAVLRLNPSHASATFLLGAVLVQTGECERAVAMLNHALTLKYQDAAPVYYMLAQAYQKMGRMDLAQGALRRSRELGYVGPQPEVHPTDGKEQP